MKYWLTFLLSALVYSPAFSQGSDAAANKTQNTPHVPGTDSLPLSVSVAIFIVVAIVLIGGLGWVTKSIGEPIKPDVQNWSLAKALSEKEPILDASGKTTDQYVSSSSRLIAFFGMVVLIAFYIGCAAVALFRLTNDLGFQDMDSMVKFLVSGVALFVPYSFNQIQKAISGK